MFECIALIVANREYHEKDEEDCRLKFAETDTGINQIGSFFLMAIPGLDHAQVANAKAAFLAAIYRSTHSAICTWSMKTLL